jgi:LacI family transcriptional regulator
MHAPERFSSLTLAALLSQIKSFAPFRLTLRCHIVEETTPEELVRELRRCGNDSYGVLLKASDHPLLQSAVAELAALRVPVVTMVTDLPHSERIRYVGMDNEGAGRSADLYPDVRSAGTGQHHPVRLQRWRRQQRHPAGLCGDGS